MTDTGEQRLQTGIPGMDDVLHGGLLAGSSYLVSGGPGTGKTTLGFHFLRRADPGRAVFISLGEPEGQIRRNAAGFGLPLDGVDVLDLSPTGEEAELDTTYDLLEAWEAEGSNIHTRVADHVREHEPTHVVIDSLSHLRYLSPNAFQFRKQVLSLLRHLTSTGATVLFTAEESTDPTDSTDAELQFLSDGVIHLRRTGAGRICEVTKMRGSGFEQGTHFYDIESSGLCVYPRLIPAEHGGTHDQDSMSSGLGEFDALTGGGISRATVTMLSGASGVGKTSLGAQFVTAAACRGERSVIYSFDEGRGTFLARCQGIGMPLEEMLDSGQLAFEAVEPMRYHPDQFAFRVRDEVERRGVKMVMLDSLSGYGQAVRGENLVERVHALCRYLTNMGVSVILTNEVFSIAGDDFRISEFGVSYLADTVIVMRYLELDGELRKCVGVLKKRTGDFEKSLREFEITSEGFVVGEPLRGLRGILRGVPESVSSGTAGGDKHGDRR